MWSRAARWSASFLMLGCGGLAKSSDQSNDDAIVLPTSDTLVGEWRHDYITAGTIAYYTRLRFEEGGLLVVDTESMTSLTEPPALGHHEGSWEDGRPGAVKYEYEWGDGARAEAENDLTFVEGRMLEEHPCCVRAFSDRFWTHRGYRAANARRTNFHRESMRREVAPDGTMVNYRRTSVDLAFSASPASLVRRDDCSLDVTAHLEALEDAVLLARDFAITLPCTVTEDDFDLVVVLVPGWDTVEGMSLLDYPYRAGEVWRLILEERGDTTDWPESLRGALWDAFEPYVAFDRTRPDVLFHRVEAESLAIKGYSLVQPE